MSAVIAIVVSVLAIVSVFFGWRAVKKKETVAQPSAPIPPAPDPELEHRARELVAEADKAERMTQTLSKAERESISARIKELGKKLESRRKP